MRKLHLWMLALMVLSCTLANGQSMSKRGESFTPAEFLAKRSAFQQQQFQDHYFLKTSFKNTLSLDEQNRLQDLGISLLKGYGNNEFLVKIPKSLSNEALLRANIDEFTLDDPMVKISGEIKETEIPSWAAAANGKVKITIAFLKNTNTEIVNSILNSFDATPLPSKTNQSHLQSVTINKSNINQLAAHPLVASVEYIQAPDEMLLFENRSLQRVNQIQSNIAGGLNLDGTGVCIGIGDGGELGDHIDFGTRVVNKASGTYDSFGSHGDHVHGIIGGGGCIDPRHRGIAFNSTLISQKTSLITYYMPEYYEEHGMVLTNNSYGTSSTCSLNGQYNTTSGYLDQQLLDYPDVLHVFAAGNSGGSSCGDYPSGYRTVLRYYQSAKNILTVGNIQEDRSININSSRGPVMDGRLKPELVGVGTSVISTGRDYNYYSGSGTSMAAPSVTGVLALLYQRYRELNSNVNPRAALLKAIACNTAEDLGNPGPDFTFGFGLINASRAEKVLEDENYFLGSLSSGGQEAHKLEVPAGIGQLKVMLYWNDQEGDPNAAQALVNDLDISVTSDAGTYLPWVLDTEPANVANDATRGADHINNIEQITLDNPAAGTYTIDITAFDIPLGVQDYVLTYEYVMPEIEVTFPMGGEKLDPNDTHMIRWAVEAFNTSTFKVEWSANNGGSWQLIQDNVDANIRDLEWTVPSEYTENALVRVTRIDTGQEDISDANFEIIAVPKNLTAVAGCARTIDLSWDAVSGASSYEVLMFDGSAFQIVGKTADVTYKVSSQMELDEMYWFTVRSVMPSDKKSERAVAVAGIPDSEDPCDWENDALVFLPEIIRGRQLTSSELTSDHTLEMTVLNVGQNDINTFTIYYSINGLDPVSETFFVTLLSGESNTITFTEGLSLNGVGEYNLSGWIEIPGDTNDGNDIIQSTLFAEQLDHQPIELPYTEDFSVNNFELTGYHFAIADYQAFDVNTGAEGEFEILKVGNEKVASLARTALWEEGVTFAEATLNLNLADFYRTIDPIILSFKYMGHSNTSPTGIAPGNKVLFRGSDQDEWITLHEMSFSKSWTEVNGIDLSALMVSEAQDFTTSAQIKFVQDDFFSFYIDDVYLNSASRLPVEMGSFEVVKTDDDNGIVTWTTESEFENDHFEVQVANENNGITSFTTIGRVEGQGISTRKTNYEYVDVEPNKTGVRYYRIKQVDIDGTATYTSIKQLLFRENIAKVSVYPNPVIERFSLHYEAEQEEMTEVRLVNLAGKVLFQNPLFITEGNHEFPFELDAHLEAGLYMLQIVHANTRVTSIPISKTRD